MFLRGAGLIALATAVSGCGTFGAINDTRALPGDTALLVDANHRAIVAGTREGETAQSRVVCAEPSPDAVTARSMAGGGSVAAQSAGSAAANFASSEASTNIGLRTPTIQLLRDGMYRLCESYLNGAIDGDAYTVLLNRYQEMMVGLVAIEQLTGTVYAAGAEARAGEAQARSTAMLIDDLRRDRELYERRRQQTSERLLRIEEEISTSDDGRRAALEAERDILKKDFDLYVDMTRDFSESLSAVVANAGAEAAAGRGQGSSGEGASGRAAPGQQATAAPNDAVANAVLKITTQITQNNLSTMGCYRVVTDLFDGDRPATPAPVEAAVGIDVLQFCMGVLQQQLNNASSVLGANEQARAGLPRIEVGQRVRDLAGAGPPPAGQ